MRRRKRRITDRNLMAFATVGATILTVCTVAGMLTPEETEPVFNPDTVTEVERVPMVESMAVTEMETDLDPMEEPAPAEEQTPAEEPVKPPDTESVPEPSPEPETDPEPLPEEPAEAPDPALEGMQALGYHEEIPLPYSLQIALYSACQKTGCDYALALAVIEQETDFRNVMGDHGDSYGYMQVQKRWQKSRMKQWGVTDLMDPGSNFLIGCDILAECVRNRGYYQQALTCYNVGHWPGGNNAYSSSAIQKYYKWNAIVN